VYAPHAPDSAGPCRNCLEAQFATNTMTQADGDLPNSSRTEEERRQSAHQPVAQRDVRRRLASTPQGEQLLLEQEILRDHRAHAAGAAQLRSHDGQVKQGEQELLHARDSVGQTSGARNVGSPWIQRENWQFETHPRKLDPEQAVGCGQNQARSARAFQHQELVPQCEHLEVQRRALANQRTYRMQD
jgi:hypothetical protein